jgi:hypothetical protein
VPNLICKDFIHNEKLVKIEPKWNFQRIYLLTKAATNKTFNYSIYEIDLRFRVISKLSSFDAQSESTQVLLAADPFQG